MNARTLGVVSMMFAAFLAGCPGENIREAPTDLATPENSIAIEETGLIIFGERLDRPPRIEDLQAIFGKHNSVYRLVSDIYVWDELGIYAYMEGHKPWVTELSLSFGNRGYAFSPTHLYRGSVIVGDRVFSGASKKRDMKKGGFRYLAEIHRCERQIGLFHVIAEMNEDTSRIVDLTIGMNDWEW